MFDLPLIDVAGVFAKAPDWAISGSSALVTNRFSIKYAREAMWRAVTLQKINSAGALTPVTVPTRLSSAFQPNLQQQATRNAYWATMFRSLGNATHLLQDMAQPQHTRADKHSGVACGWGRCPGGHASYFENYVESRAANRATFSLRERVYWGLDANASNETILPTALETRNYLVPNFKEYADYFSTATGSSSLAGKGLANYSNQGFYSAGTNINSANGAGYPSPPRVASSLASLRLQAGQVRNAAGTAVNGGVLDLLIGTVADANDPTATANLVALSSYSAFDQFVQFIGGARVFTLNHYNYADQARLLIPRAVSYSAGLINHLFRSSLDITGPDDGLMAIVNQSGCAPCTFNKLKVNIRNTSSTEALTAGYFVAVATFHTNNAFQSTLQGEPGAPGFPGLNARSTGETIVISGVVSSPMLTGSQLGPLEKQAFSFDFANGIPVNATDLSIQIAFRGMRGSEVDAVVVGSKDISEPTFWGFANITDFVWDEPNQRFQPLPFGGYAAASDVINTSLRYGSPTAPIIASLPKFKVGQHARLAFLTDLTPQSFFVDSQLNTSTNSVQAPIDGFQPAQFFSPPNSTLYDANIPVSAHRGLYHQHYMFWGLPAGDGVVFLACSHTERCDQKTLPALDPANVLAWNVVF